VARWCQSFGMVTVGYDPIMAPEVAARAGIAPVTLEELWARSDYITLHTPRTPETANLICAASLARCKTGVRIVNVARGGLLHYGDVLEALQTGRLAGVGIDVYHTEPFPDPARDPFLSHPHVIATPHVAGVTHVSYANMGRLTAANVQRVLSGQRPLGAVNGDAVAAAAEKRKN